MSTFPTYSTSGKPAKPTAPSLGWPYDGYSSLLKPTTGPYSTGNYGPAGSGLSDLGLDRGGVSNPFIHAEDSDAGGWWSGLDDAQKGRVKEGVVSGIGLLGSLFAPDSVDVTGPIAEAQTSARKLSQTGSDLSQQGSEALAPVMRYLAAMTSGDPQAILAATAPDRRKILDQYDTARQMAQFGPRGGGTASATIDQNTREASDLALLAPTARSNAMKLSADLGSVLTQTGAQAESAAASHMANLLTPIMQQRAHDEQSTFNTFASIASLAMMFAV